MASSSLPKGGRLKLGVGVHRIGPRMDVFNQWLVPKDLVGMAEKIYSEFAGYLLENLEEMTQSTGGNQLLSTVTLGGCVYRYL